jgi:hypothetical protein
MRILVCGGRDFDDWDLLHSTLYNIWNQQEDLTQDFYIIEGGAIGADFLARVWAKYMNVGHGFFHAVEFPADWKTHGKAAGPIRNQKMLDEGKPDLVVAFPGGVGTADMVRRAKKAGVKVIEVTYG